MGRNFCSLWDLVTSAKRKFHTPNMERLAKCAMRFTDVYAKPFFLYMAHYGVHLPYNAGKRLKKNCVQMPSHQSTGKPVLWPDEIKFGNLNEIPFTFRDHNMQ